LIRYLYNKFKNRFPLLLIKSKIQNYIKSQLDKELLVLANKINHVELKFKTYSNIENLGKLIPENFPFGLGCNIIILQNCILEIGNGAYIGRYVEIGPWREISIGEYTSIQDRCILLGDVFIGRYCTLSYNIYISSGWHNYSYKPYLNIKDQDKLIQSEVSYKDFTKPVIIEDDVWIGYNVIIMSGIHIGKGSVIGANSVVTKDIPAYSVVVGSPAKVIKKRLNFKPPSEIRWDRQEDYPYFYSGFCLSLSELQIYNEFGGLAVFKNFSVALEVKRNVKILIRIKKIINEDLSVRLGLEEKVLTSEFQDLLFLNIPENEIIKFKIIGKNEREDKLVIVSNLKLINS
jgi:acetyltransferase-like isoleucine patch superfamily enzyme